MARNKGGFVFASNFEVKLKEALDPRVVVSTKTDLINKETWPYDGDTIYLYNGLIVAVADSGTLYMLVDSSKATSADYSGWKQLDAAAAPEAIEIVNSLTSDSTTSALAAAQGKVLMNAISTLENKLSGIYSYKGTVNTYEELPTEVEVGDVYNVVAAYDGNLAGTNYAWTGSAWDALGGSIDLSSYYNKTEVDAAISTAVDTENKRAVAEEERLAGLIESNTNRISTVTSDVVKNTSDINNMSTQISTINGTISDIQTDIESIQTANDTQDNRLTILENLVSGGEGGESDTTLMEMVSKNTTDIANLTSTVSGLGTDLTALEAKVDANTNALTTLNGDSTVQGSVDYKIEQALSWINIK